MGNTDRVLRVLVAGLFLGLYLGGVVSGVLAMVLLLLAGVFFLTAILGTCPLYSVFGMNTCPRKGKSA